MSNANYRMIDQLNMQKNYKAANHEINKMLKEDENNYILLNKKIKVLIKMGQLEEAEQLIEEKKELIEDQINILKGHIEKRKGNIAKALYYYKKELERSDDLNAYTLIGNLLEEYGALDLADKCYERVENAPCEKRVALLGRGRIAIQQDEKEKAEEIYKKILEMDELEGTSNLMALEIYKENYGKAYDYMCELPIYYLRKKETKAKNEEFFLKYKLDMLTKNEKSNSNDYIKKQIIDYDEERFYKEIDRIIDNQNTNGYKFTINDRKELSEILKEEKINLNKKTPISIGITNQYIAKCPKVIGKSNIENQETKTLSIITLSGTNNIINAFPVPEYFSEYKDDGNVRKKIK